MILPVHSAGQTCRKKTDWSNTFFRKFPSSYSLTQLHCIASECRSFQTEDIPFIISTQTNDDAIPFCIIQWSSLVQLFMYTIASFFMRKFHKNSSKFNQSWCYINEIGLQDENSTWWVVILNAVDAISTEYNPWIGQWAQFYFKEFKTVQSPGCWLLYWRQKLAFRNGTYSMRIKPRRTDSWRVKAWYQNDLAFEHVIEFFSLDSHPARSSIRASSIV